MLLSNNASAPNTCVKELETQMKKKAWSIFGLILVVVFAAITLVSHFKGGCTSMIECTSGSMPMKCHWTFIAATFVGLAGMVMGIVATMLEATDGRRAAVIGAMVSAIVVILIVSPIGIGTCAHADSMCNSTATIVYVLSAVAIILAIVMGVKADSAEAEKPKMTL